MAVIYLRSTDGSNSDDGLTWANAKATLAAALTAAGAGGTVYVSDNHAELGTASITLASPGTSASPVRVICVDDTGDPEPPTAQSTGASVDTNGTNRAITFSGVAASFGVKYICDREVQFATGGSAWYIDTPEIEAGQDGNSAGGLVIGNGGGGGGNNDIVVRIKGALRFGATTQRIRCDGGKAEFVLTGGLLGTLPTTLIASLDTSPKTLRDITFIGSDLSALGSGKNLVSADNMLGTIRFIDCKLGSSVTPVTGTFQEPNTLVVELVNCDSADTNYRFHRQNYQATETQETTIVRTGGASDGTTTFSRKVVTTANVTPHFAYESMWMSRWNETTGSAITATVEIVTDNVTLTDAEAWLEVEYLGTSGFPLALFATDRVSDPIFGTPANQTTSSETWTTTGLGTPVKQNLAVTFTPQEKGPFRCRVCVAKASTTVYYDPEVTVS